MCCACLAQGEEVRQVEALVNGWIAEGFPVTTREMAIDDARAAGALAMFDEKYGDTVRVLPQPLGLPFQTLRPRSLIQSLIGAFMSL